MIDLDFAVQGVEIARSAAAPLLLFKLRIVNRAPAVPVEQALVQCQIRIEATHRGYGEGERERLSDLFGAPADWDRTLRNLLWTTASVSVPSFAEACTVDIPVPCSYDFNIAATRFFHGVEEGAAPLSFLFSGTIFFRNAEGDLQIAQIPHDKEATCRLPVEVWRSMMDRYYPDSMWLRIDRELFEEVDRYRRRHRIVDVQTALRRLLETAPAEARQ